MSVTKDPQWTVEFSVYDNTTKARRTVQSEGHNLLIVFAEAVSGARSMLDQDAVRTFDEIMLPAPESGR